MCLDDGRVGIGRLGSCENEEVGCFFLGGVDIVGLVYGWVGGSMDVVVN